MGGGNRARGGRRDILMAEYLVQGESITAVADAIREKGGTTAPLSFPAGMAEAVRDIPSGGTDISLGLTAATVGQTIKVKAVDASGVPTAWEAVDAASGAETWELIAEIDVDVDAANDVFVWEYKNLPNYKELAYKKVNLVGSTETASGISISINGSVPQASGLTYPPKGYPKSNYGRILLLPFGWVHITSVDSNNPTNYAAGSLSGIYNAIPVDGDSITSVKLSAHTIYKIAGGKLSLYGRR
jgi:hypothetical protein